jgi:PST family polysaccharide transporter
MTSIDDLKAKAVRGGFARLCGQAASVFLRLAFLVVMARLLDPKDFGLVSMVTVVTGFYGLFTTAGLSSATVQSLTISDRQVSTLFWINLLAGLLLGLVCVVTAPLLVAFYGDQRLLWLTIVIGAGFPIATLGVQHRALLERDLRYGVLALIDAFSQLASIFVGIAMALTGFGYWSLVAATLVAPAATTAGTWLAAGWVPGRPSRNADIGFHLRFGGTITLNSVVIYVGYNAEKILLGRFWGADALGLYGRAYQLIAYPTDFFNSALGNVAFAVLSRLQDDPVRLKRYYLKFYSFCVSITLPITIFCGMFAYDIVVVLLGPQWISAVPIFRLLAPTALIFGIINPLGWLLLSIGLQVRSLRIALAITPLVTISYTLGLPYGPTGVAFAYSSALIVWLVPHVIWSLRGTIFSPLDLLPPVLQPLLSGCVAALAVVAVRQLLGPQSAPIVDLLVSGTLMGVVYYVMLLFVFRQKDVYIDLLTSFRGVRGANPEPAE